MTRQNGVIKEAQFIVRSKLDEIFVAINAKAILSKRVNFFIIYTFLRLSEVDRPQPPPATPCSIVSNSLVLVSTTNTNVSTQRLTYFKKNTGVG